jgi:amino acid transporter
MLVVLVCIRWNRQGYYLVGQLGHRLAVVELDRKSYRTLKLFRQVQTADTFCSSLQFMATTWIRFDNAMKAQGLKREEFLPYRSWAQPYAAWFALIVSTIILILSGYTLFYPGRWSTVDFIFQCEFAR